MTLSANRDRCTAATDINFRPAPRADRRVRGPAPAAGHVSVSRICRGWRAGELRCEPDCRATRQSGPLTTRGIDPPSKVGEEGIFMEEMRLGSSALRASGPRRDVMVEPDEVTAMLRLKQIGWGTRRI